MQNPTRRACVCAAVMLAALIAPALGASPSHVFLGDSGVAGGGKGSGGARDSFAYHAVSDTLDVLMGELSGGTCWNIEWNYTYAPGKNASAVYAQEYSLWFDGAIHRSRDLTCSSIEADFQVEDYFGTGMNDPDNYARTRSENFTVGMTVTVDGRSRQPGQATFVKITYDITNTGPAAEDDVRFFALADYDIPNTDLDNYTDDLGDYDSVSDVVWVRDDRYFAVGLTSGNRHSDAHGIDWYQTEVWVDDGDGQLNGNDSYGPGDPGVGEQWNIGTLGPGASWTVDVMIWFNGEALFADAGGPYFRAEGNTITFDASASRGMGALQYRWSFDSRITWSPWSPNPLLQHSWLDDFTGFACVQVTNGSASREDCDTVLVANRAPAANVWASPNPVPPGQPVTLYGNFTDPGILDTHTATWDFGDGSPNESGSFSPGVGNALHEMDAIQHTYLAEGDFTVRLQVQDDDGGSGSAFVEVAVLATPPDYVPRNARPASPITVGLAQHISFSLDASNVGGSTPNSSTTIAFFNESMASSPFFVYDLPPIMAGSSVGPISANWTSPATPGTYLVRAHIDPSDYVNESDETNNVYTWTVHVVGGPSTSLVVGKPNYASTTVYIRSATHLGFSAHDNSGLGIRNTTYRIDGGNWINYTEFGAFVLSAEGERDLEWRSLDWAGNLEPIVSTHLRVDNTPPVTTIIGSDANATTATVFNLTAADAGCGVNMTRYRIDGGNWTVYSGGFTLPEGVHNISYFSTDMLNNTETVKWHEVTVSGQQPEATQNMKPVVAAVFAVALLLAGVWSSWRRPWKNRKEKIGVAEAFAITSTPFVVAEAITGIVSLLTGQLSIPPAFGLGTLIDVSILLAGFVVASVRGLKPRSPRPPPPQIR